MVSAIAGGTSLVEGVLLKVDRVTLRKIVSQLMKKYPGFAGYFLLSSILISCCRLRVYETYGAHKILTVEFE